MSVSDLPEALPRREQLLRLLADGASHSGERLAEQLGVTRAAVWKLVQSLRELHIEIDAQHQGYRLPHALELYDATRINRWLTTPVAVEVLFTVDSTNRYVNQLTLGATPQLCVAEVQQAGRGRRGRVWQAPFGSGLCMSVGRLFAALPPGFSALSLVVGVAVVRVLRDYARGIRPEQVEAIGLKWPNDVLWCGRKLAGVLIEMRGDPNGAAQVVIGMGMNVLLPVATRQQLASEVAVCDLTEMLGNAPSRNDLVGRLTQTLLDCLQQFAEQGFAPFMDEWSAYDVMRDQAVKILSGEQQIDGIARGVSDDGSLLLETAQGMKRFVSGEVSLRRAQS